MRVRISGILVAIESTGILGQLERWIAKFKGGRVHHRWVDVQVDVTKHQAVALRELVGGPQAYEYVFYDHVMEVIDHTGQHPRTLVETRETPSA
jgi:hypothetical protein